MNSSQITLKYITTLCCEGYFEYPYYPITALITQQEATYLAVKNYTGIYIQIINQKQNTLVEKPFSVDCQNLPKDKSITAIEFVKRQIVFGNLKKQLNGQQVAKSIFLLIGYATGELFLLLIREKQGKIIWCFNQFFEEVEKKSFFKKTFSFLIPNTNSYKIWQNFAILRITCKRSLTYLLRNNYIVHTYSLITNITNIQKKINKLDDFSNSAVYCQQQKGIHIISNSKFNHVWDSNGFILSFKSTVSGYHINQKFFFVSIFDGYFFVFNRLNMKCLHQISTQIGIRRISTFNQIIILCLQDDRVQLIDIQNNMFLNLTGHNSFASHSKVINNNLFIASFDGTISITKIPQKQNWISLFKPGKLKEIEIGHKIQIMNPSCGIGSFKTVNNLLICSMQDFSIQILLIS